MSETRKVLIIDHDPRARFLIKGVLTRDLNVPVTEVDTALDGLELLEKEPFLFVLLELALPTMSGVRVLEILRQTPHLAATPVVALTSKCDEPTIRRVIELGIAGVITKPLDRSKLGERLLTYMNHLASRRGTHVETAPAGLGVAAGTGAVLIADGDANFRHFVTSTLRGGQRILSAATGVDALRLALEHKPAVALIGQDLGVLRSDVLVMEMRGQSKLQSMRIVGVAPKGRSDLGASSHHYDGIVTRTFVPDLFREQFDRQFQPAGLIDRLLAEYPWLRASITSAVEQICGMVVGIEVTELPSHTEMTGQIVDAYQDLTIPGLGVSFRVSTSSEIASARVLASKLVRSEAGDVTDEDVGAGVGQVSTIVAGRLRNSMGERGVALDVGPPQSRTCLSTETVETDVNRLRLFFGSVDQAVMLAVTLSPSEGTAAAA